MDMMGPTLPQKEKLRAAKDKVFLVDGIKNIEEIPN